jgi:RNA ligase (TIGR02306 family)
MSTLICPVVEVSSWGKHPNADTLSITQVFGNHVIFRTCDFVQPDRSSFSAVYIPEEALLPEDPRWAFLWANRAKEGKSIREIDRVVKALKLRGIFSCGLLIPVPDLIVLDDLKYVPEVGQDLASALGITKFEKPEQVGSGGDNASSPPWFRKYTEIENARGVLDPSSDQARHTLFEGYNVVITEKIHGANTRYTCYDGLFWVGSHANAKALDSVNWWTSAAKHQGIEEICRKNQGLLLFGEVCGPVQKGYSYGQKVPYFILFDIYDYIIEDPHWLSWDHVRRFGEEYGLPVVPELYRGPWVSLEHAARFADGPSQFPGANHNREGCVVKADPEIYNPYIGRGVLKIVGEDYLLRKYSKV